MQILFTRFPLESAYGGAEVQTMALMEGLRGRGHDVTFLGSCPVLLGRCRALGIKNDELRIGAPPVTKWGAVSFLWRGRKMRHLLEQAVNCQLSVVHCDAVLMLSMSEKLLLTSKLRHRGVPVFWIEHDAIGRWLTRNPWLPRLRSLSDAVTTVVVSDLSRDLYLALGWDPRNLMTIPNGITTPVGIRTGDPGATLRIGCIARLQQEKGVDLLLRAVCDLPDTTLEVLGQGREEEKIRSLAAMCRNANGNERIKFTSFIPDIERFFARIDVLVLPSRRHDPFGLAAAEAMIRGIPTIVTDACGISRHLTSGTEALIVPADSPHAIRDALIALRNPETHRSIAEAGRKAAERNFRLSTMVDRYEELLKSSRSQ